jgi:[ribosomal protein S5]-alanine N-acetyltransferase
MKATILESKNLIFKPLSLDHLSYDYVDWLNDKDVNRYLESGNDYTLNKLRNFLIEVEKKMILFWAIHIKSDDTHIGNIKIDPIDNKHGSGEYGILLGKKSEWGKGYAKEASITIIKYCFEQVGLKKITLGVIEDNIAAVGLYKKIGFLQEARLKKHGLYNYKYCDMLRMALFNKD